MKYEKLARDIADALGGVPITSDLPTTVRLD